MLVNSGSALMAPMFLHIVFVVFLGVFSVEGLKTRTEPFGADGGVTLKRGPYRMGPDIPPMLITNNFTSADEFRITFDIKPYQLPEKWSSLLRFTNNTYDEGVDGARMPNFLIEANSTHLATYMGGPEWSNVECRHNSVSHKAPDLQINKTSQVMALLLGDTLVTYIDRVMTCLQHRFHHRYRSIPNVSVWLGDEFDPPAPVIISNVHYATLQNPGSANLADDDPVTTRELRGADALFLNISMGFSLELERIKLEAESVERNLAASTEIIHRVQGRLQSRDGESDLTSLAVGSSEAKLKQLTSDLQEHDYDLQTSKVRAQLEVKEIEDGIAALAPQIEAMTTVLETLGVSIGPDSSAAQVVGMMKQIKEDMDHRKAALEEELPAKSQSMADVVKSRLEALRATEAEYTRQSLHYSREFARFQELRSLSSTTLRLRKPWREAEQHVAVAQNKVSHFIGWLPSLQEHVEGDVRVGREMVQRILDRFKVAGHSPHRDDILENETERLGWGLEGPEGAEGHYDENLGEAPPGYNGEFPPGMVPESSALQVSRQLSPRLPLIQSSPKTPPRSGRRLARISRSAVSANASRISTATHASLVSSAVTAVLGQVPQSYRAVTALGDSFAIEAAAALVERGALQLGSAGMHKLADQVRTVPKAEAVSLLNSLHADMLQRDANDANIEKEDQQKCEQRQQLALGEKKRARILHHQLLLQNASVSGELRSVSARLGMLDVHLDNITEILNLQTHGHVQRPLKNNTLRMYMMQDISDIRKGLLRWTAQKIAHPATIGGIDTSCGQVVDGIRQVQDETREESDVVDEHLDAVRSVLQASVHEAEQERDGLVSQMPQREEELRSVGKRLEEAEQALADADEEVAESEVSCGSVQILSTRRSEEEALVNVALELLGGLSDADH